MRQVLILAILVIAAMAAKNCSSVSAPSGTANYFMPPVGCVNNDTSVKSCITGYGECVKAAQNCEEVNKCFLGRMICFIVVNTQASECQAWSTGLDNAGLYLTAGGTYKDSTLERACEYALCRGNAEAFEQGKKATNGDICPADFATVCATAPSFEAPTRAPTDPEYTVTFGGTEWAAVLKDAPKDSAKYKKIEAALSKGLSKVLGVPSWLIIITEISVGSLIVKFIVRPDPTGQTAPINPDTAISKLTALVNDATTVANSFTELKEATGVTPTVSGVVGDVPTPTPDGTTPATDAPATNAPNGTATPSAAGLVSVAAAVVAIVAMML